MWDSDDADDIWLASFFFNPATWIETLAVLAVIIGAYWFAHCNELDCAKLHCSNGRSAKLMNHECLCVEKAK